MTGIVWSLCTDARLIWKQWGDDVIIYHENSGNTHCLNLFAATALKILAEGAASAGELAGKVSVQLSVPCDSQAGDSVNAMLTELRSLGITQAAST